MEQKFNETLQVTSNLKLAKLKPLRMPKKPAINEELNEYLRAQILGLSKENDDLKQELAGKDIEKQTAQTKVDELLVKISNYEAVCGKNEFISPSQYANSKLIDLSKKLREKNAEVETFKTKCSKLEQNQAELTQKLESSTVPEAPAKKDEPEEMKKLQDKLTITTSKLLEARNSNFQLKNDLKIANKWLQQEVGDNIDILSNTCTNNWRGRAQIIFDLQQKNNDLKEKLKLYQKGETPTPVKYDKKNELLEKENVELKASLQDARKKVDIAKARIKVLETEVAIQKQKISKFTNDSAQDKETIADYTAKITYQEENLQNVVKQKDMIIHNMEKEFESMRLELQKQKCVEDNHLKTVEEKNQQIEALQKNRKNRNMRPTSSYQDRPKTAENEEFKKLEAEKFKLLELLDVQNSRIQEERDSHSKTQSQLRYERQRGAKLEATLARKELETPKSVYTTNKQNKCFDNFKDQLELAEENIKAMSKRLEIEIYERKMDVQEFSKIIQNYDYK